MVVSIILLSLGLIFAGLFIYGKVTNYKVTTNILKLITSLLFVSLAVYLFIYKGYPNVGIFIIAGAFFGMIGDIALGLKRIFKEKDKLLTGLGMLFFLIGHIVYITGLSINFYDGSNFLLVLIPSILSVLVGASLLVFEKKMDLDLGSLRIPGVFYLICLSLVPFISFSYLIGQSFNSVFLIMMTIGGVFFFISDIILSKTYFSENVKRRDLILSSVTYYLAQFIIAFALFFL